MSYAFILRKSELHPSAAICRNANLKPETTPCFPSAEQERLPGIAEGLGQSSNNADFLLVREDAIGKHTAS